MTDHEVRYEFNPEGALIFFLRDGLRAVVTARTSTRQKVELYKDQHLMSPDVGDLSNASFRRRLVRAATETFKSEPPHLEEDLGRVALALERNVGEEDEEGDSKTLMGALLGNVPSVTELLLEFGEEAELFHDPDGEAYATISVESHYETWHLKSRGFKNWLRHRYHVKRKELAEHPATKMFGNPLPGVVRAQLLNDAIGQLEAKAQFDGPEYPVHVRIAERDGVVYVDLGDKAWKAVEVTLKGRRVVHDPPVKFVRPKGMLPLPEPKSGSGGLETLRGLLNLGEGEEADKAWRLIVAWLVQAFRPRGPYPILILQGPPGAAKSTAERILHHLVDPVTAPLRTTPKNERDLFIAATSGWIVAYDNISHLPPWLSDAICRLSTGGGFSTRTLYENREQELFDAMRPVILNGISDVATRSDLLDRSIIVTLPKMEDEDRRPEQKLWAELEEIRSEVLGEILDAVSTGLRDLLDTKLNALPRMADFALWVAAAESGLGWETGTFMDAYEENRGETTILALESEPVADAVLQFMEGRNEWSGTASVLLEKLGSCVSEHQKRSKAWPKAAHVLTGRLRRLVAPLKDVDIEFSEDREGHAGQNSRSFRPGRGSRRPGAPERVARCA